MVTWQQSLPAWPLGGAKYFFSNSIFSATVRGISEIFSGSCAPRKALLNFRGTMGWESNLGARPPNVIFFHFFLWYLSRGWGRNLSYKNHSNGGPLWCLKFKKKIIIFFLYWVQSFWGWGTLLSSPPWGLLSPTWPLQILVLGTLIKMVFVRGIAPHLGEIWGLASVHFGPLFLEIHSTDFGIVNLIDSTYSLLSILRFF